MSSPPITTRASRPRRAKLLAEGGQVGLRVLVGIGPRRAEDGPSLADDAVGFARSRGRSEVPDQPAPAFENSQAAPTCIGDPLDHGADDRVQPRTITATGQQADVHGAIPMLAIVRMTDLEGQSPALISEINRGRPWGRSMSLPRRPWAGQCGRAAWSSSSPVRHFSSRAEVSAGPGG